MKFIYPTGSFEKITNKDKKNGYAGLDENGLIKLIELKDIGLGNLNKTMLGLLIYSWEVE